MQELFDKLLKDIKVELSDEFDRNFQRKAFFDRTWKPAKVNNIGSLMMRTGALRKSLMAKVEPMAVRWTSSLPYADIHNSGGNITVTVKMKKYAWYRYRVLTGGKVETGHAPSNPEADFWKAMALKPVGSVIVIPQRQFIGDHPQVQRFVREVSERWFTNDVAPVITAELKRYTD